MEKQVILILSLFFILGCQQSKEEKSFKVFNDGVSLSLEAENLIENGNIEEGTQLYLKSIEKYKETLEIDSSHTGAISGIALGFYGIRKYDEALNWFEKAVKAEPNLAVNYLFWGLSQINTGQVEAGKISIARAMELDTSSRLRNVAIENLSYIGNLAYAHGDDYIAEGNKEEGIKYHKFGIRVLILALGYNKNNMELCKLIESYAIKMNDDNLLEGIRELILSRK